VASRALLVATAALTEFFDVFPLLVVRTLLFGILSRAVVVLVVRNPAVSPRLERD
jgi:hypothetical protein